MRRGGRKWETKKRYVKVAREDAEERTKMRK